MTEDTKKPKLKELFQNHPFNQVKPEKRAEDLLNLIRDKKKVAEIAMRKYIDHYCGHLSQSDMHRLVADQYDLNINKMADQD